MRRRLTIDRRAEDFSWTQTRVLRAAEKSGLFRGLLPIDNTRATRNRYSSSMSRGRLVYFVKSRRAVRSVQTFSIPVSRNTRSRFIVAGRRFPTAYSTDVIREMDTPHQPLYGEHSCRRRYLSLTGTTPKTRRIYTRPVRCNTRINLHSRNTRSECHTRGIGARTHGR